MARIFRCDRCQEYAAERPFNRGVHYATVRSNHVQDDDEYSNTKTEHELCESCYNDVIRLLASPPPKCVPR